MARRTQGLDIAVIGTGIAGMSAAWLLSRRHRVTVFEMNARMGGHCRTVDVPTPRGTIPIDMGFIVFNERNYPNLSALFHHLGVASQPSGMSFAVSLRGGALEYSGADLRGVFGQKSNFLRPRFWSMLADILRFYRHAPIDANRLADGESLGGYLAARGYGRGFIEDHLLPMAAAIWSTPVDRVADHPATGFIRFCQRHGLLQLRDRPQWRTVVGGSHAYVEKLTASFADRVRLACAARSLRRDPDHVTLIDAAGETSRHDHVVVATHSDEALALLADPSPAERQLLGGLRYSENAAVMHFDAALMPRRRAVWASWNYIGSDPSAMPCITYWMNRLHDLPAGTRDIFVTLNPVRPPAPELVIHREGFAHPLFDAAAIDAQRRIRSLQGLRRTWFCGAYLGAGFHEDGLVSGLAVAEALGGVAPPWGAPQAMPVLETAAMAAE